MTTDRVLGKVEKFLLTCEGLDRGVLVGVSGGADSICLTHALFRLGSQGFFPKMLIAHVNHGLRGNESDSDHKFVEDFAATLKSQNAVKVDYISTKVCSNPNQKGNLENIARSHRYQFFSSQLVANAMDWVFTAHNQNDQVETILMRLLRGASMKGLGGIPLKRSLGDSGWVGRPLLTVSRKGILKYLEENNLAWREDSSNKSPRFLRNRVRNQMLPIMHEMIGNRFEKGLLSLSGAARKSFYREDQLIKALLPGIEKTRVGEKLVLSLEVLALLSVPVRASLLVYLWRREGWAMDSMNSNRWRSVAHSMIQKGWSVDMPEGIRLENTGFTIVIGPKDRH